MNCRCTLLVLLTLLLTFTLEAQAQRIRVQGNKFLVGDNPIFMLGANTPWNNWNEFGNSFNASWWNTHLASLHNSGLNCTRVWISCNGDNASPGISASGAVSAPTAAFWDHVGQLFQIAETNKIYLMIALISFDHTKAGNKNAQAWRAMYKSAANRQTFVDNYVKPLLQRFGSNPYFWAIDVGNELDWVHENDSVPIADVFDLVARVANAVHANSQVLVTLGTGAGPKYLSPTYGTNYYSNAELQKLQQGAYLDFYNDHYYDWMTQWFSTPFEKGPSDWQIDDKPCILGEYAAKGHGSGYSPAECLQKAYALGWLGVMPWTSNGVDVNGSLSDFGSAFKTWSDAHKDLVFPPDASNPGPFTLTVTPPQGGTISVSPVLSQYPKGSTVTLTAIPAAGNELLKWTGDATGSVSPVTLTMTRNMTVSAQFVAAGELIRNGTFDNNASGWNLGQYEGGAATGSVTNGTYTITITNGGSDVWHVQLLQAGLSLQSGRTYELSFDASATAARSLFVAVGEASGTYQKYLQQTIGLTTATQHFSFPFTPTATTSNARVEFNLGQSTVGITLDNISLRRAGSSAVRHSSTTAASGCNVVYHAPTRTFSLHGLAGNDVRIEGFSVNGRCVFDHRKRAVAGTLVLTMPADAPQVLLVRGTMNGSPLFTRTILGGK